MTAAESAAKYAARGWPVFPVKARRKEPLTLDGFKSATTAAARITKWWATWPDSPAGKEHPVRVSAPVVVNGEIPNPDGNQLHRAQYVEFEAKANGRYEFNVDAWN